MGGLVQFENGRVLYYPYTPNQGAGYAFLALFAAATLAHIFFMARYRTWNFIPMILGGICELFGYYGRAWGGKEPNSPSPFMLQLMLILVAPVFVCGTLYVTLGKYKEAILDEGRGRPGKKRRSGGCCCACCCACTCGPTTLFVLTDVVAFCSQIGGGLVQITGDPRIMAIGEHVVLAGLAFQLAVLAVYCALVLRFYRRCDLAVSAFAPRLWRPHVLALAAAVLAVWVRNLVRLVEFAQGFHGFVSEHEAMLYVFDALPMLFVMLALLAAHPGRLAREFERARGAKDLLAAGGGRSSSSDPPPPPGFVTSYELPPSWRRPEEGV